MDSRQQFEEWVRARAEKAPSGFYPQLLHRCTLDETRYVISWVDSAFEGWQASRESIVVELPDHFDKYESGDFMYWAEDVEKAITESGLKYK